MQECLDWCQELIGRAYRYRIVPLFGGKIVPSLAVQDTSFGATPDYDFADQWCDVLDQPILVSAGADAFDEALMALSEISAVVACRSLDNLRPSEEVFFERSLDSLRKARERLSIFDKDGVDEFSYALQLIDDCYARVVAESGDQELDAHSEKPFWQEAFDALEGEHSEWTTQMAGLRVLLRQSEASSVET